MRIDWKDIAGRVGSLRDNGERGGTRYATKALAMLLGDDALVEAVDYYVSQLTGSELARSVLWLLRPPAAMRRCYQLYREATDRETRVTAIELLRVVADRTALPWVKEFLADADEDVQTMGAGVLDQLLWSEKVEPDECETLLRLMRDHSNQHVRETHAWIMGFLADRKDDDKTEPPDGSDSGKPGEETE